MARCTVEGKNNHTLVQALKSLLKHKSIYNTNIKTIVKVLNMDLLQITCWELLQQQDSLQCSLTLCCSDQVKL